MLQLLHIDWTVDPNLIEDPLTIRWYGLLFAVAFLLGHSVLRRIFSNEGVPEKQLDKVLIYTMIGTIIGARLGHVFFYQWDYYSEHLSEIPMIWKGGLASHGGAVGIVLALWYFSKKVSKRPLLWILDRVATPVALGGVFIRLGNLMNHEIVGRPSDVPWAFVFERVDPVPRHPAQLYEAIAYLLIFLVLFFMYWRGRAYKREGRLIGSFLVLVFSSRFLIEYFKEYQVPAWRAADAEPFLSMGQWLSIPFILIGILLIGRSFSKAPMEGDAEKKQATG